MRPPLEVSTFLAPRRFWDYAYDNGNTSWVVVGKTSQESEFRQIKKKNTSTRKPRLKATETTPLHPSSSQLLILTTKTHAFITRRPPYGQLLEIKHCGGKPGARSNANG
jgi:hypothetical protein